MRTMNWTRIFFGACLAFVVFNALGAATWYLYLEKPWRAALESLGHPFQLTPAYATFWLVWSFGVCLASVWLYAVLRARMGPGPRTAAAAGFAYWIIGGLLPTLAWGSAGLFPVDLLVIDVATYMGLLVAATLAGAWLYKE